MVAGGRGGAEEATDGRGNESWNAATPNPRGRSVATATSTGCCLYSPGAPTTLVPPKDTSPFPNSREQIEPDNHTHTATTSHTREPPAAPPEQLKRDGGTTQKFYTFPAGLRPNLAYFGFIVYDTTPSLASRHAHLQVARAKDAPLWIIVLSIVCFLVGALVTTIVMYAVYKRMWRRWRIRTVDTGTGTDNIEVNNRPHGSGASGRLDLQCPLSVSEQLRMSLLQGDVLSGLLLGTPSPDRPFLHRNQNPSLQELVGLLPRTSLSSGSSWESASTCSTLVSMGDQRDILGGTRGSPTRSWDNATPLHIGLHRTSTDSLLLNCDRENAGFDLVSEIT